MIEDFNLLSSEDAEDRLYACLANRRWAREVAFGRPYPSLELLLEAAEEATHDFTSDEWLAAMRAHPRIGERSGDAPASSAREQSRVTQASDSTLSELAAENRRYEKRFGHVFLIAASGRTAGEILSELRRRMKNDTIRELDEAAGELRKIARLRVERVVSS